jgi:hypothetical protein
MLALLASPWLPLAAAFLSGLLVKWLLDLFFLRRSWFETQATLLTRERQITDLRHELNRSIETLKNRTIELDATVKAKAAAEALGTQRLSENLVIAERAAAELAQLQQARSEDASLAANLRAEVQTLLGHVSGERSLRRSAESEALDLKLHQATAASLASDQESSLQSLRLARQLAVSENETLRPLIDQARHELAAQLTVNAALLGAVQLRDTTLEGLRTQLASAEAECQSVSQLLARQDEERKRLTEVQTALAEAEARCASSQAEADAARLQLESVQTQRMDFDAALMLKEAQANAWERECRNAKNRADTAVRKSATDAQALESLKAELAACQTELAAVNGAPTASAAPTADPALAQRMKDLETELAVVSESHARLESELAETKALASRAEDLSEQLGTVEAELAALKLEPAPSPSGDLETLLQDLDTLTRERNRLAAEVAALKSTGTRPDSV